MSRYLLFAFINVTLFITAVSGTSAAVAFPEIQLDLGASLVLAGWVLSTSQLAIVAISPIAGKVCDTFGRKRSFLFFAILFTAGSALCAIAPNIYLLILFRLVQGAGAGGFLPAAVSTAAETFPHSRQKSVGLITTVQTFGMIIGPTLGGWLTQDFGWRSIFWFNIPWGMAALAGLAILMKSDEKNARARIDGGGAALFAASLSTFMVGLTLLGSSASSAGWIPAAGLMALGVVMIFVFGWHESRSKDPVIDIRLLRGKAFLASNIFNFLYGFSIGVMGLVPLYAVTVYGVSTFQSGLLLAPRNVAMMIVSIIAAFSLARIGYRKPLVAGTIAIAVSCVVLAFESPGFAVLGISISGPAIMVLAFVIAGAGMGFTSPAANNAGIELLPDKVAAIVGTRRMFLQAGVAFGIVITTIVVARFSEIARGFQVVMAFTVITSLVSLPFVMGMPRSASDGPRGAPGKGAKAVKAEE